MVHRLGSALGRLAARPQFAFLGWGLAIFLSAALIWIVNQRTSERDELAFDLADTQRSVAALQVLASDRLTEIVTLESRIEELEAAALPPSPEPPPPPPPKPSPPVEEPPTSAYAGDPAYEASFKTCSSFTPKELAEEFNADGTDPDSIAFAYSRELWELAKQQAAYEGCFDALI